ncbi:MAG TPA: phosphohistidine phosphatase SixA [Nitrososphaerales archaeon]|nr:phosphohistidine phosphatase SixA [Nitrososphaerales archaeon]
MDLYLLRHAEAGKRMAIAVRDRERALTVAGKEEIEKVGEALAEAGFKFDVFATSPVKRAKSSALIVNKALKRKASVEEWPELSPEGSREALYRRLAKLKPDSSVACVGHEPYLTTAIGEIIGGSSGSRASTRIALKKAGLAKVSVTGFSPRINGELRWLLTPKQIRKIA